MAAGRRGIGFHGREFFLSVRAFQVANRRLECFGVEVVGVFPEVFEGVVFPLFSGKEVDDEVDGVDDEPAAGVEAFLGEEFDIVLLEGFLDVIAESSEVGVGGAGGDEEGGRGA